MFLSARPAALLARLRVGLARAFGVALSSVTLHGATAYAQSAPTVPAPVGVSASALMQGIAGLIVIIALLLVTLAALKRWGGQFRGASTAGMKVISGISVGTRERILLVEVGDTWLVVGVTASQIRTLHTLPKDSAPDLAEAQAKPAFAKWLSTVTERKKNEA